MENLIINKEITCCFTGHRDLHGITADDMRAAVLEELERLYSLGVRCFLSGGAVGFDTVGAEAVIVLKRTHPDAKLYFILPCAGHVRHWTEESKNYFNKLFRHADGGKILAERYYDGCMHVRNRYMVDNSSYCISFCTETRGGSFSTVRYAKQNGVTITEISNKFPNLSERR